MSGFSERLDPVERGHLLAAIETAADQLGLGVFVARVDLEPPVLLYVSAKAAALVGRTSDELIGQPPWVVLAPEARDRLRALIASRQGEQPPMYLEYEIERGDGRRFPVEVGVARVRTGEALLTVGYFRDVTEQHQAVE